MPADESPFDLPTAAALVRLRVFLEDARRRAQDLSDPGRHLGLIALDGVVEYALWLVAQTIQAPLKRERPSFGELQTAVTNRLREEGREWQVAGRAGVDQLRRARNEAQHAAVAPAVEQMPRWADSAHAYIESLLVAAFSLRVSDIALAIAVRDEPLRTRLAQAEAAIEIGESEFGFSYAYIAFEEARSRWRSQRLGGLVPEPDVMTFPDSTAGLRARVGQLEDLLEVQAFTSDLGEYVSLLHSRRQQEIGWQPEPEDARRALVFAVGWIVRWEVFTSGYPAERWAEWEESIEPPTTADGKPGTVVSADATLGACPSNGPGT